MTRARIAICVDGLGEGWLGGVNYFRNLIKAFDQVNPSNLTLFVLTDDATFLAGDAVSDRVRIIELPMLRQKSAPWYARKVIQAMAGRDLLLLNKLDSLGIELVAFSFVQGARRQGIGCAPWIPDFQSERHPEFFPAKLAKAEHRRTSKYLKDAGTLIVSSESARADAETYFGMPPDQVHVVSFAPRIDAEVGAASLRDQALEKYRIARPYFFIPNQYWQHKNHFVVARALEVLKKAGCPPERLPLVISTGSTSDHRNPAHFAEFERFLHQGELAGNFKILGIIPRRDMLVLMANCVALINPSLFEGWSSTVEEAKALGKNLLVSDIPVHREQVRHYADSATFDPYDPDALARLLADAAPQDGSFDRWKCQPNGQLYESFLKTYMNVLNRLVERGQHA